MIYKIIFVTILGFPFIALAAIYKSHSPNGATVFSDQPTPEAQRIYVDNKNFYKTNFSSSAPNIFSSPILEKKSTLIHILKITILKPNNEDTIPPGEYYSVIIKVQPALMEQQQISLLINGAVLKTMSGNGTEEIIFSDLDPLTTLNVGENIVNVKVDTTLSEPIKIFRHLPPHVRTQTKP